MRIEIDVEDLDIYRFFVDISHLHGAPCAIRIPVVVVQNTPVAAFSYTFSYENCQTVITFTNNSYIYDGVNNDRVPDEFLWDFGTIANPSSNFTPPSITVSNLNDTTIYVSLSVFLSNSIYDSTITVPIFVPDLRRPLPNPILNDTICFGQTIFFGGYFLSPPPGLHTFFDTIPHPITACDSIVHLRVTVRPEIIFSLTPHDVVGAPNTGWIDVTTSVVGYEWYLNGVRNAPLTGLAGGEYTVILVYDGCLSAPQTVTIIQDCLKVEWIEVEFVCDTATTDAFLEIRYSLGIGHRSTFDVLFSDEALAAGFSDVLNVPADEQPLQILLPANVRPKRYTANVLFRDVVCQDTIIPVSFTVYHPARMLMQKWDNLIEILELGLYEFYDFQWFKNGVALVNENNPTLYIRDGVLDFDAEYWVELTRKDDGMRLRSCPAIIAPRGTNYLPPGVNVSTSLHPTILRAGESAVLNLSQAANALVYNTLGILQSNTRFENIGTHSLFISHQSGYFLVRVIQDDGRQEVFRVIVR